MHYPGQTNVTIRVEKIQLKDPASYFEPFFTVSVKGGRTHCCNCLRAAAIALACMHRFYR